jgi:hypothetical protein
MAEMRRFGAADIVLLLVVVLVAGGVRAGYLILCADSAHSSGPVLVQDDAPAQATLVENLKKDYSFKSTAPFSAGEEETAHVSPGYPWFLALLARISADLDSTVRWAQCGLGALTAGLYFLFARRAFRNLIVATLAGLFCALHPFWVIDTAALADGTLISFLVALTLWMGTRVGQEGGAFGSLVYGLVLAATALVRAALLPFAFVAMSWMLLRSRRLAGGWLCALLAFLGFAIGLSPWTVRNFQVFSKERPELVPIVDSTHLHLWIGNNPKANGGPLTDEMKATVTKDLSGMTQPDRYAYLGRNYAWEEVCNHPGETLHRRIQAAIAFYLGSAWVEHHGTLAATVSPPPSGDTAARFSEITPVLLLATLLVMLALGLLGWRWTYGWRWEAMPSSLAFIWIPLPYVLSHAEMLSGPRLPLDGLLLTYAAFAILCCVPGIGKELFAGGDGPEEQGS